MSYCVLILFLGGDPAPPKGYVCPRAARAIKVDGRLDDPDWARAPWTDAFVDIEGDARPRPRFETRAKMLWDDEYFYVAAELREPDVWGTIVEHDAVIFRDNDFEVFLDPDGDSHEYYEFEINALNTGWDLFLKRPYRDGGPADNAWEIPGLKTAVHVDGTLNRPGDSDRGWTVEIAFPWKALEKYAHRACPPVEGDQWRVNFSRVEWRTTVAGGTYAKVAGSKEDNWVWSPQGVVDMHRPERWGYVQFTRGDAAATRFTPDLTGPARDRLSAVYRAQKEFRARRGVWAPTLRDLGIDPGSPPIDLKADAGGYRASIATGVGPGRISIGEDSRFRVEPGPR